MFWHIWKYKKSLGRCLSALFPSVCRHKSIVCTAYQRFSRLAEYKKRPAGTAENSTESAWAIAGKQRRFSLRERYIKAPP